MDKARRSNYTKFGKLIKMQLIEQGMTASELAVELGTTPQYLNKILHGERSGEKYREAMVRILHMNVSKEGKK